MDKTTKAFVIAACSVVIAADGIYAFGIAHNAFALLQERWAIEEAQRQGYNTQQFRSYRPKRYATYADRYQEIKEETEETYASFVDRCRNSEKPVN